jgi:hypothetical protein
MTRKLTDKQYCNLEGITIDKDSHIWDAVKEVE